MGHVCNGCGEQFETLTGLRLHDCPEAEAVGVTERDEMQSGHAAAAERTRARNQERLERARELTGARLDEALESATTGDSGSALTALAHLEQELQTVREREDTEAYRDVYWGYYEPMVTALDAISRTEGWSFLLDVAAAYDPRDDDRMPVVGAPVTNAIARGVVRTRLTDGVTAVPTPAVEFLASVPRIHRGDSGIGWEESMHLGWAIGHPDHDVAGTILGHVQRDDIWATAAGVRALYADQHAAVDLYCDLLRETPTEDRPLVLDDLANLADDPYDRWFPEHWDVGAEFDWEFAFTFDESVERQLRAVVEELGLVEGFSDDWSFADLELEWGPEDLQW